MAETKAKVSQPQSNHVTVSVVMIFAVAMLLPVFVLGATGSLLPRSAEAAVVDMGFGGYITGYVPVLIPPTPATPIPCPAHIIIHNVNPSLPPVMGLFFIPGGRFYYEWSEFLTGSTAFEIPPNVIAEFPPKISNVLGKVYLFPYVCSVPYPLFPVALDVEGQYYIGTSCPVVSVFVCLKKFGNP